MARVVPEVQEALDARVAELGYELVEVEWAGSGRRPIVRIRIDLAEGRAQDEERTSVSVSDCARVSRGLEAWMDGLATLPERYVLEVSSPGLERPLIRARDFARFAGSPVAVKGRGTLAGRARRLEGELVGLIACGEGEERVRLRLHDGDEVEIPRDQIARVHIVFR